MAVDCPSDHIYLFIRKCKGDQRRDDIDKLVLGVPVAPDPLHADLMERYIDQLDHFCASKFSCPPLTHVWNFSPLKNSSDWQTAATLSSLLELAYTFVGATPHPASNEHRTTSTKAPQPPLAASERPSP
jgi:hypothetical protein